MKAIRALVLSALAAGSLAIAADAGAQTHHGGFTRGSSTGTHHWSGRTAATWSGSHWSGGYRGHYYYPRSHVSFFFGVPLLWPGFYYGYPYYYDPYYYPRTVIYRDVEPYPMSYPEAEMGPAAEAAPGPGAPSQGPLYMNYCESAKAYYPKVTACPEGWKFVAPAR